MERKTLRELVKRLEWEKENRYDIVVPTDQLRVVADVGTNMIKMEVPQPNGTMKSHGITNFAHGQIASKCDIPKNYYDKMISTGKFDLLSNNINTWLPQKEQRLVRVLDNDVRALLSDRYRVIDNYDVFYAGLEELDKVKSKTDIDIDVKRADLTETNMYIKVTSPQLVDEVNYKGNVGEPIHGGIIIQNSEVGCGSFTVKPYIHVLVCSNGMISDRALRRVHLGRKQDEGIVDWSNETRELEDAALWSKIRDMIQSTFNPEVFHKWVDEINKVASTDIPKPTIAVDNILSHFKLPKTRKDDLLNQFAKESNTQWGLAMAVTRVAQDLGDYNQQIEWERVGSKILETKPEIIVRED